MDVYRAGREEEKYEGEKESVKKERDWTFLYDPS